MKIRMLESVAGRDFALSAGDCTDRFSDKEANRFIKAGIAEKAPVEVAKKPETKKEWDQEREMLLAENVQLKAENEALSAREAELLQKIEGLSAFQASVVVALGVDGGARETAVAPAAPEKRG